tara:strand:+ start:2536 stop:2781 length:246 start_codon:yes stop_codon:yes gene_type:complete
MSKLPKWFDGEVYPEGGKAKNAFSGKEYQLTAEELSMYDFIMGAQIILQMGMTQPQTISDMKKGLEWFRENNSKAYMVLLD